MELIKKIEKIRLDKRLSVESIVRELGIARMTYIRWKRDETKPSDININTLKNYINEHEKQLSKK